jgi:transcriptional regulator GlxA family with amidase domain
VTRHIGILLFDDVEELDAVGPWEVLSWWTRNFPDDGWAVSTMAGSDGPVRCAKGMHIVPDHGLRDIPRLDVLVHPGGFGTRALMKDESHLVWLQELARDATLMTSVCTGSLVYAAAGLLRGRPATTYWEALDLLQQTDPTIELRPRDRYVDDGDVITSSGVSAGIDMALHLVRRLAGEDRARQARRGIQYDPEPPV